MVRTSLFAEFQIVLLVEKRRGIVTKRFNGDKEEEQRRFQIVVMVGDGASRADDSSSI